MVSLKPNPAPKLLRAAGVLCVLTVDGVQQDPVLRARLADGGLTAIELTLRTPVAIDAIAAIRHDLPAAGDRRRHGAGTGAGGGGRGRGRPILVSPGVSPALLDALAASPLPSVPAPRRRARLMALHARGFHVAKWFPAAMLGGVAMLKAIQGPLPQMKLCANGGIDASSAADYPALPNVLCVGGSWMVPKDWLAAGAWDKVCRCGEGSGGIAAAGGK